MAVTMLLFQPYEAIGRFGVNFVHVCRHSNELSVTKTNINWKWTSSYQNIYKTLISAEYIVKVLNYLNFWKVYRATYNSFLFGLIVFWG
jgi:hypothetical protein